MDNGDDVENGEKMFSKPRQSSTSQVYIGVKSDQSNAKMKHWNVYYNAPVSMSTGGASFRDGYDRTDLSQFFRNLFVAIMCIVITIGLCVYAAALVTVFAGLFVPHAIIYALDVIQIGAMLVELGLTGELGGFEGSSLYNACPLLRALYHTVFDWDGTIVRCVALGDMFDGTDFRFKGG
jgi:hypothetical protein